MTTPTWDLVIEDMKARDLMGRERYNTPLVPHNGRSSLQDAYEEALDLAVYLKNAILERVKDDAVVISRQQLLELGFVLNYHPEDGFFFIKDNIKIRV